MAIEWFVLRKCYLKMNTKFSIRKWCFFLNTKKRCEVLGVWWESNSFETLLGLLFLLSVKFLKHNVLNETLLIICWHFRRAICYYQSDSSSPIVDDWVGSSSLTMKHLHLDWYYFWCTNQSWERFEKKILETKFRL